MSRIVSRPILWPVPEALEWNAAVDWCHQRGLNVVGATCAETFDRCQPPGRRLRERMPECQTVMVIGSGGTRGWEAICDELGHEPAARRNRHPIDDWTVRVASELVADFEGRGVSAMALTSRRETWLNFRQLAEMAGVGTVSPVIGQLLHPQYGPWVSLRGALLLEGRPFGDLSRDAEPFDPCTACHRPCLDACPAGVYETGDVTSCATHRVDGGCATGCDVLRACPLGVDEAYSPNEQAYRHTHGLFQMRRWLGAGWWRLVPRFLRR